MITERMKIPAWKSALPDDVLRSVEKPARYLGNEVNEAAKDRSGVDVSFVMCFPDVYEVGMSHLGIQILYDMFNRREDTYCDRVYSPWKDLDRILRDRKIPLFAVESQDPVKSFDFLGITLQYEMCYTNILQVLDLSGIPLRSVDRTLDDPFVIGGGPCTYNPEPVAPFFDLFYIGEGETRYGELIEAYKEWKHSGSRNRLEFLEKAAEIPGIYVPQFYAVTYREDGTIGAFTPVNPNAKRRITREVVRDMNGAVYPDRPLVPHIRAVQDRAVLEVQRGCIRGCRFCQAGMIYRPVRERSAHQLEDLAIRMLQNTGHDEISLSSLSTSDYSELPELLHFLISYCSERRINISLPSLRIDSFSLDVMRQVQDVRKGSLTFAPEGGTQKMRDAINKGLTEQVIMDGAMQAFHGGWNRVKLYFMLGQPNETEEDRKGIPLLAETMAEHYYEIPKSERNGKCQITISTAFFVPKPFTPFQWAVMSGPEEYLAMARTVNHTLKEQKNQKSIRYEWHDAETTVLEGILARGDRRLADVIEMVYRTGEIFDAWSENVRYDVWMDCLAACGLSADFYNRRQRTKEEILPWDFIDIGVSRAFLWKEWEKSAAGERTPNCREQCAGCGAARYGTGVCLEKRSAE